MSLRSVFVPFAIGAASAAHADDLLSAYEGNALPQIETPGWQNGNPCDPPCQETVENGFLVHYWAVPGDSVGYYYWLARPPLAPPPTLWIEWQFRSNHHTGPFSFNCDGRFSIQYAGMFDVVYMYGDAAISFEGGDHVLGLEMDEFHSYRFESLNGIDYEISVDGKIFIRDSRNQPNVSSILQFSSDGGCIDDWVPDLVNEWDFVRFGAISFGERIVASDPPSGFVDARIHPALDRFTITYDSPNYVYIDDITVDVLPSGNEATRQGGKAGNAETRKRGNAEIDGESPQFNIQNSAFPIPNPSRDREGADQFSIQNSAFAIPNPSRDRQEADPFSIQNSAFPIPVVVATRRLDNGPPDVVQIVLDRPIPYNATTRFTFNDGTLSQSLEYTFAPGDTNGDGLADLADFAAFQTCFGAVPLAGVCLALDADSDGALDLRDFAALLTAMDPS